MASRSDFGFNPAGRRDIHTPSNWIGLILPFHDGESAPFARWRICSVCAIERRSERSTYEQYESVSTLVNLRITRPRTIMKVATPLLGPVCHFWFGYQALCRHY